MIGFSNCSLFSILLLFFIVACECDSLSLFPTTINPLRVRLLPSRIWSITSRKSMSKLTIIGVYIRSTQMKWIMLFAKAIYIYRHGEHTAITHTPTERRISNFRPNMYIVRLIVHPSTNTPYNSSTTGTKNARVAKGKSDGFHTNTENNIEISVMCWAKSGSRERKKRGTRIYALFSCYGVHLSAYPNLFWLDSTENWMKISARFFPFNSNGNGNACGIPLIHGHWVPVLIDVIQNHAPNNNNRNNGKMCAVALIKMSLAFIHLGILPEPQQERFFLPWKMNWKLLIRIAAIQKQKASAFSQCWP